MMENAVKGIVISVNTSLLKGEKKSPVEKVVIVPCLGIEGDAHAGPGERQISLLALESIEKMREKGYDAKNGDFAENLTIKGILLWELKPGDVLKVGGEVILKITRIGKICYERCNIYYQVGDCVMPREGVFAEVVCGGVVRPGDSVILADSMTGSVSS
jgi:MOSC domain-containing protein YiiM